MFGKFCIIIPSYYLKPNNDTIQLNSKHWRSSNVSIECAHSCSVGKSSSTLTIVQFVTWWRRRLPTAVSRRSLCCCKSSISKKSSTYKGDTIAYPITSLEIPSRMMMNWLILNMDWDSRRTQPLHLFTYSVQSSPDRKLKRPMLQLLLLSRSINRQHLHLIPIRILLHRLYTVSPLPTTNISTLRVWKNSNPPMLKLNASFRHYEAIQIYHLNSTTVFCTSYFHPLRTIERKNWSTFLFRWWNLCSSRSTTIRSLVVTSLWSEPFTRFNNSTGGRRWNNPSSIMSRVVLFVKHTMSTGGSARVFSIPSNHRTVRICYSASITAVRSRLRQTETVTFYVWPTISRSSSMLSLCRCALPLPLPMPFFKEHVCRYGVPKSIISDQGTSFNNQLMLSMAKLLGYHHIFCTAYHPQSNGQTERFNCTFVVQLAKLTDRESNNWDQYLYSIVFAYNTGLHSTTNFSPFELMYGRRANLPIDQPPTTFTFSQPNDYFHQLVRTLAHYHTAVKQNISRRQQQSKTRYDHHRHDPRYELGTTVLTRTFRNKSKLDPSFSIHPKVIVKHDHPTYWVKDVSTDQLSRVHVNDLRPLTNNWIGPLDPSLYSPSSFLFQCSRWITIRPEDPSETFNWCSITNRFFHHWWPQCWFTRFQERSPQLSIPNLPYQARMNSPLNHRLNLFDRFTVYTWKMSSSSSSTTTESSIQPLLLLNHRRTNLFPSKLKSSMIDSTIRLINNMNPRLLHSHVSIKLLACWHERSHTNFTRSTLFNMFSFFPFLSLSTFVIRDCIADVLDLSCIFSFYRTVTFFVVANKKNKQGWILFIFFLQQASVLWSV